MRGEPAERTRTLVSAFVHDAVSRWLVPDERIREEVYLAWFDVLLDHADRAGRVRATRSAVQVWLRAEDGSPPGLPAEEEPRIAELAGPHADRFAAFGELTGARHPREPHWYLALIGVRPDLQGRGVGTAALTASLREHDRAGSPTYLEASSPASRALYLRLGYADAGEPIELPGGPVLHPMWRPVGGA
ncbi:GNAT family N-acetyltransferase [Saccharopolyspora sp. MS10]|uniref:GNAT family N-acetyltransferase n=1 Tax=Saccharopolyspora sp. MS10 TaxID=3385973 RepID=UPI0039A11EB7